MAETNVGYNNQYSTDGATDPAHGPAVEFATSTVIKL